MRINFSTALTLMKLAGCPCAASQGNIPLPAITVDCYIQSLIPNIISDIQEKKLDPTDNSSFLLLALFNFINVDLTQQTYRERLENLKKALLNLERDEFIQLFTIQKMELTTAGIIFRSKMKQEDLLQHCFRFIVPAKLPFIPSCFLEDAIRCFELQASILGYSLSESEKSLLKCCIQTFNLSEELRADQKVYPEITLESLEKNKAMIEEYVGIIKKLRDCKDQIEILSNYNFSSGCVSDGCLRLEAADTLIFLKYFRFFKPYLSDITSIEMPFDEVELSKMGNVRERDTTILDLVPDELSELIDLQELHIFIDLSTHLQYFPWTENDDTDTTEETDSKEDGIIFTSNVKDNVGNDHPENNQNIANPQQEDITDSLNSDQQQLNHFDFPEAPIENDTYFEELDNLLVDFESRAFDIVFSDTNIKKLENLKSLKISNLNVDCSYLYNLNGLENLQSLKFKNCRFSDDYIKLPEMESLERLELQDCGLESIPNVSKVGTLKVLGLQGNLGISKISEDDAAILENIEELNLAFCSLKAVLKLQRLTKLHTLNLTGSIRSFGIFEELVAVIRRLGNLDNLAVGIRGYGNLENLISSIQDSEILGRFLNDIHGLGDLENVISRVYRFDNLENLIKAIRDFNNLEIVRSAFTAPALKNLNISSCEIQSFPDQIIYQQPVTPDQQNDLPRGISQLEYVNVSVNPITKLSTAKNITRIDASYGQAKNLELIGSFENVKEMNLVETRVEKIKEFIQSGSMPKTLKTSYLEHGAPNIKDLIQKKIKRVDSVGLKLCSWDLVMLGFGGNSSKITTWTRNVDNDGKPLCIDPSENNRQGPNSPSVKRKRENGSKNYGREKMQAV